MTSHDLIERPTGSNPMGARFRPRFRTVLVALFAGVVVLVETTLVGPELVLLTLFFLLMSLDPDRVRATAGRWFEWMLGLPRVLLAAVAVAVAGLEILFGGIALVLLTMIVLPVLLGLGAAYFDTAEHELGPDRRPPDPT